MKEEEFLKTRTAQKDNLVITRTEALNGLKAYKKLVLSTTTPYDDDLNELVEPKQYIGALEFAIGEDYDEALKYQQALTTAQLLTKEELIVKLREKNKKVTKEAELLAGLGYDDQLKIDKLRTELTQANQLEKQREVIEGVSKQREQLIAYEINKNGVSQHRASERVDSYLKWKV